MANKLLKKVTILYVEDDDNIRQIVQRGIKRRVKELYVAVDGEDGFLKFKEFKPDIIVTDIKMPKMDGIEMAKKIKAINKDVPIIVMSAHSETDYLLESIELGMYAYLLKPIDKDKLFNELVHASKDILYEKQEKEHKKLIQELIDLQPSIIFSADDENKLLFVNKTFLDFFCCESTIKDIKEEDLSLDLFFKNNCDKLISQNKIDGINWIEYIMKNPNQNIKIDFNKDDVNYSFLIKEKLIEYESGRKDMVMTLTNLSE